MSHIPSYVSRDRSSLTNHGLFVPHAPPSPNGGGAGGEGRKIGGGGEAGGDS